jgi:hypothetical protein
MPDRTVGMRAKSVSRARIMACLILSAVIAASSLLLRCSGNPAFAGGVETTNGLIVVSSGLTVRGSAPLGSKVIIASTSYNPFAPTVELKGFCDSVSIDSGNTYSFTATRDSGNYNIYAINAVIDSGAMAPLFLVRSGRHDSLFVPLSRLGEINGSVFRISAQDTIAFGSQYVYLAGTDFFCRADSSGYFRLQHVPMGAYHIKVLSTVVLAGNAFSEKFVELADQNPVVTVDVFLP